MILIINNTGKGSHKHFNEMRIFLRVDRLFYALFGLNLIETLRNIFKVVALSKFSVPMQVAGKDK